MNMRTMMPKNRLISGTHRHSTTRLQAGAAPGERGWQAVLACNSVQGSTASAAFLAFSAM
jgi:hypothetical protein